MLHGQYGSRIWDGTIWLLDESYTYFRACLLRCNGRMEQPSSGGWASQSPLALRFRNSLACLSSLISAVVDWGNTAIYERVGAVMQHVKYSPSLQEHFFAMSMNTRVDHPVGKYCQNLIDHVQKSYEVAGRYDHKFWALWDRYSKVKSLDRSSVSRCPLICLYFHHDFSAATSQCCGLGLENYMSMCATTDYVLWSQPWSSTSGQYGC